MGKRNHGEGTLAKRRDKDGRTVGFKGAVIVGYKLDGKPDRRWVSEKTPDEVRLQMDALKTARNTGVIWSSERLTVSEYLTRWIGHKKMDGTRLKTISRYEEVVVKHLVPTLGRIALEKLVPLEVETALQTIRAGASAKSARRARSMLSMALNQAVRWRIIPFNVCHSVKPPAIPHDEDEEVRYWAAEDVVRFLKMARSHRLYALFHVGVMTGMRPCELLGLRWCDLDLEAGLIHVEQDAVVVSGKMHLGPVKTKASRRAITIPQDTVIELRAHSARQQLERIRLETPSADALRMRARRETPVQQYIDSDLVFANELGGITNYHNVYRVLQRLIEQADVTKIGLHGLRHTHASILIQRGVNAKVVSDRLGHKDVAFTLKTYAHLFEAQRREAAMAIEEFLGLRVAPLEGVRPAVTPMVRVLN
jgi:integrase